MTAIARITLLSLVLGLSACAVQRPSPDTGPAPPIPEPRPTIKPGPSTPPGKPVTPNAPAKPPGNVAPTSGSNANAAAGFAGR